MTSSKLRYAVLAILSLSLTGTASATSPEDGWYDRGYGGYQHDRYERQERYDDRYDRYERRGERVGRVIGIETVYDRHRGRNGNGTAGAVVGAIVGGALGNQVGSGSGRDAATVAGAIAGGIAGRNIDRNNDRDRGRHSDLVAVSVELRNGQIVQVIQPRREARYSVGQRVRVIERGGQMRIDRL